MRILSALSLMGLVALLSSCDYWEETSHESDVKAMLSCTQEGDKECINRLTCTEFEEGMNSEEILNVVSIIGNAKVQELVLDGKEQNGEVWRYKLGKHTIRVRWCPAEWEGSIAYMDVEAGY